MRWSVLIGLMACTEYNLDKNISNVNGGDVEDTGSTLDPDGSDGTESNDTALSNDSANNEVSSEPSSEVSAEPSSEPSSEGDSGQPVEEPSSEPVDDGGLSEPSAEPDGGFDQDGSLTPQVGNVVTILMALSDQWIPQTTAEQLIINAVDFVTDVPNPQVLVIRDDNTNGEDEDDPVNFTGWLQNAGYTVTFMEEPSNGISASDLQGFHVAIFSNPGYPPDDDNTIDALHQFSQQGYGVIIQGDDMTRTNNPNMEALTRLVGVDNGSSYYGVNIDNNNGSAYAVRMVPYNVLNTNIGAAVYPYGNDIDTTTLATTGIYVAAWATVDNTNHPEKPVITAYSPSQTVFQ